ncbi:hypothetical protein BDV18DRAFT_129147 [Aspergillus unguis]
MPTPSPHPSPDSISPDSLQLRARDFTRLQSLFRLQLMRATSTLPWPGCHRISCAFGTLCPIGFRPHRHFPSSKLLHCPLRPSRVLPLVVQANAAGYCFWTSRAQLDSLSRVRYGLRLRRLPPVSEQTTSAYLSVSSGASLRRRSALASMRLDSSFLTETSIG